MKSGGLQHTTVLVTRPEMQSKRLCELITAAGGMPLVFPTLNIVDPEDKAWLKKAIRSLDQATWAIFISPNAVIKTAPYLQALWPTLPPQLNIAAMGRGTAEALMKHNLPVTLFPEHQYNSEALLALPAFERVTGQRIVIFQGEGGRGLLAPVLEQRGAQVTQAIAYRRVLPEISIDKALPQWQETVDMVISTSGESLKNLVRLVGEENERWLLQLPLVVISSRMVTLARQLGFNQPFSAENVSDEAIVAALIRWKELYHE